MPDNIPRLLKKARRAFKSGDRGVAAHLIDRILKQDYAHHGTWEFLYREYGTGQSLQEFQREFTEQYYPEKLGLISRKPSSSQQASSPVKRQSFLSRIFSPRKRPPEKDRTSQKTPPPPQAGKSPVKQKSNTEAAPARPPAGEKAPQQIIPVQVEKPIEEAHQPAASTQTAAINTETSRVVETVAIPTDQRSDKAGSIRVLIVDDTPQTRETIIRSLSFQREIEVIATAENGSQAVELSRKTRPDVVLMDINMPDMDGITATSKVLAQVPYAQVVILTVQDDPDYMRKAMMAGAHDFLTKPPALDDLLNAIQQAGKVAHQERRKASQIQLATSGHSPGLSSRGKIITVYSPKGGTGCSTVAANLAATLHNDETNAILVDGNLQFGDITDLFKLQSRHSILELTAQADDLDYQIIEETVVTHESGIRILAPPGPESADDVGINQYIEVLENLREIYPYVLVNTTSELSSIIIATLEISDLLILLVTQDIPTVARVRKFMDTLNLLQVKPERVLVVLNQFDKHTDITPDIIGKSIKHDVNATIPKDVRIVLPALNRGVPFMLKSELKAQPVSRAMLDLAEIVRQKLLQNLAETESEAGSAR